MVWYGMVSQLFGKSIQNLLRLEIFFLKNNFEIQLWFFGWGCRVQVLFIYFFIGLLVLLFLLLILCIIYLSGSMKVPSSELCSIKIYELFHRGIIILVVPSRYHHPNFSIKVP